MPADGPCCAGGRRATHQPLLFQSQNKNETRYAIYSTYDTCAPKPTHPDPSLACLRGGLSVCAVMHAVRWQPLVPGVRAGPPGCDEAAAEPRGLRGPGVQGPDTPASGARQQRLQLRQGKREREESRLFFSSPPLAVGCFMFDVIVGLPSVVCRLFMHPVKKYGLMVVVRGVQKAWGHRGHLTPR